MPEVVLARMATHGRHLDALEPWIEGLDDLRRTLPTDGQGTSALARLLDSPPLLRDLPELAREAARELAPWTGPSPGQANDVVDRGRASTVFDAPYSPARTA